MSTPAVTAIVLAYNHGRYIHQCLSSVLAEARDLPMEILVGDDQSSDDTGAIIARLAAEHPGRITCFRHEKRLGGTGNYKFLVARARGEFTAYLDGDDFWLPGKIGAQLRFLEANPQCPAVYGNARVVDEEGRAQGTFNNPQPPLLDLDYVLRRGNFLNNSTMMYRSKHRPVLLDVPGELFDYRVHLGLARIGAVGYINQALTGYRVGSTGSAVAHDNERVRDMYWQTLLDVPATGALRMAKASAMADFLRRVLFRAIALRRIGLVRHWLPRVLAASPGGSLRTLGMALSSIVRTAWWEAYSRIAGVVGAPRPRIMYRR